MMRGRLTIVAALMLAACVQPGSLRPLESTSSPAPRIEPMMDDLIDEKPIWESRPVAANAVTVGQTIYIVIAGDNLRAIGDATQAGSENIARANNLAPPYLLYPGRILRIPAGRYHRVSTGETGIAIARAYGIPWRNIVAANDLVDPFVLRVGRRLQLPGVTVATPEARAAAFRIDIDDLETGSTAAQNTIVAAPSPRFAGRFDWPLAGAIDERFGPAGRGRLNRGIEIAALSGSDIRAAADGMVAFVGNGGLILVRHGNGWISVYGRVAQAMVATGQSVRSGQAIGRMGDAAQLHFELRKNRAPVDPVKYLPAR